MITATGAGASFCAVPPKRLRPKTPKSPRASPTSRSQNPHAPVPMSSSPPLVREPPLHAPAPIIQSFLLSRTQSTSSGNQSINHPPALDVGESEWSQNKGFTEDDLFTGFQPSSLQLEGQEPPSPKSFYSVATTSTTSTTRAIGNRLSLSLDDVPAHLLTQTQHQQSSVPKAYGQAQRQRPSSPPAPLDLSLEFAAAMEPAPISGGLGASSFASFSGGPVCGYSSSAPAHHGEKRMSLKGFSNANPMRDICIAVVGAGGVGKSTFLQKVCDLKSLPEKNVICSKIVTMDRNACSVRLVEIDWTKLNTDSNHLVWPRAADGQRPPFVDGVLLLYDVTNPASITRLPDFLDAFARTSLPALVVSCKCDAPQRQLNPSSIEQVGIVGGYETLQTSANSPDSQKKCVTAILNIIARKNEKSPRCLNGRRRANSSATSSSRATSPRPSTARSGHSRASSEFSTTFLRDFPEGSLHGTHAAQARIPRSPALGTLAIHSSMTPTPSTHRDTAPLDNNWTHKTSGASTSHNKLATSSAPPLLEVVSTSPFSMQPQFHRAPQSGGPYINPYETDRTRHSFLEIDGENDSPRDPDDIPILERDEDVDGFGDPEKPTQSKGFTWDELVDRLLRQPMSKGDANFATIFLCFYRKIFPPRDLLNSILARFDKMNVDQKIVLHRISTQLRYCGILHQWVTTHPGDFAHPKTKQKMTNFLNAISGNRSLSLLACEMRQVLAMGVDDEDAVWARSDLDTERKDSLKSFLTTTSMSEDSITAEGFCTSTSTSPEKNLRIPGSEAEFGRRMSEVHSASSVSTATPLINHKYMEPTTPVGSASGIMKEQYDVFMSIQDEDIAHELTRIDWAEFSKIRPRDLLRHVSIPPDQKEDNPSLRHVNQMISHFNHVAYWVASVILEKPKPKHRAKALEKFMDIAWILRHMNNYNALGAVIAGINGTAIHRLALTRELVPVEKQKQFMRLELLMGTHKSHSKYRLAWDNTSTERIPFLPLHRRDLVSAEEGNRTFLQDGDQRINWNKFQVMGDVLMVLIKSQGTPYREFSRNLTVEKLILDSVLSMNDDELYERSVQLENVAGADNQKRRRGWFQR